MLGISWPLAGLFGLLALTVETGDNKPLAMLAGISAFVGVLGAASWIGMQHQQPSGRQQLLSTLSRNEWIEFRTSHVVVAQMSKVDWKMPGYRFQSVAQHFLFFVLRRESTDPPILCLCNEPFERFKVGRETIVRSTLEPILVAGNPYEGAVATTPQFDRMYVLEPFNKTSTLSLKVFDTYNKEVKPYLEHLAGMRL